MMQHRSKYDMMQHRSEYDMRQHRKGDKLRLKTLQHEEEAGLMSDYIVLLSQYYIII